MGTRSKNVTMADIAIQAGVSKNTVSLALRDSTRVSTSTRQRIHDIAKRMGYRQNATVSHLMAVLRSSQTAESQATLGLINANEDPNAFTQHQTIPVYVNGCKRRATQRGYGLDLFWLHHPELRGQQLAKILRARNINGLVIVGMMKQNVLPDHFRPIWENFACIVAGVRTHNPALSFSSVDHHALVLHAYEEAYSLGYRRPALVLDSVIDHLVEGRFTSGFMIGQQKFSRREDRTRPFYDVTKARIDLSVFSKWLERQRPDAIFTLHHETREWLETHGWQVPDDIGLVQLEWRMEHSEWAGMEQHNDITGEVAIDMAITRIHQNEFGLPPYPRASLIGASWKDGETVRNVTAR